VLDEEVGAKNGLEKIEANRPEENEVIPVEQRAERGADDDRTVPGLCSIPR